jgi:snRNA-activating protein complex subunit 3
MNASDLRLKTLEEAIQTATAAPVEDEAISSASDQAGPSRLAPINTLPTSLQQQQQLQPLLGEALAQPQRHIDTVSTAPEPELVSRQREDLLELTKDQIEKQQTIDAYNSAVAAAKLNYKQEQSTAAQHLHTLQAYPLEGSEKLGRRSFASVKPLETAEVATEVPIEEERKNSRRGAASAAAAVPAGEVVISVAVHLPQAPAYVSEEWLVLGSQNLTDLRDSLYCLTETNIKNVEKDENMRRPTTASLTLSQQSSYFYIEGSFFIDTRNFNSHTKSSNTKAINDASDLSEEIRKYLKHVNVKAPPHPVPGPSSRPLGPFTTDYSVASMQDRVFEDLWVRLGIGAAGLFCHQGGCEHLIVFLDVRAHDPAIDPPLIAQYPYKIADPGASLRRKRDCEACDLRFARKVTYGDKSAPHTPYFWCEECYEAMHYDDNGSALYTDFRVFPYEADYNPMILHEKSTVGGPAAAVLRRE